MFSLYDQKFSHLILKKNQNNSFQKCYTLRVITETFSVDAGIDDNLVPQDFNNHKVNTLGKDVEIEPFWN